MLEEGDGEVVDTMTSLEVVETMLEELITVMEVVDVEVVEVDVEVLGFTMIIIVIIYGKISYAKCFKHITVFKST